MKIKSDFITREVAGEVVVVPTGEAAARFQGMITLNPSAEFLWKHLQEDNTEENLLKEMLEEFDVSEEIARKDIKGFVGMLWEQGILEE